MFHNIKLISKNRLKSSVVYGYKGRLPIFVCTTTYALYQHMLGMGACMFLRGSTSVESTHAYVATAKVATAKNHGIILHV